MSETAWRNVVRWGLGVLASAMFAVAGSGSAFAAGVTGAADNLRTGWYPDEPSLAPQRMATGRFQRIFEDQLRGQIYAQPLVANGTLLAVTEEDWAYGLDPVTGAVRWETQVGTAVEAGEGATIKCQPAGSRIGVTGTPVIDVEHNLAYFVATSYISGGSGPIGSYLHALELANGKEAPGFPVEITGHAQNLGSVTFEPLQQLQRPALLLMNGVVYAAFGSYCDNPPWEGWIVGVSTEGKVVAKWVTTAHGGSIWQSGGGLVSDGAGQILFSTGNASAEPGAWDPPVGSGKQTPEPEGSLAESVVRVEAQSNGELATTDYFSPFNSKFLDEEDLDLGSTPPVGLPSPYFGNTKIPHLAVVETKEGTAYLLNRDSLGGRAEKSNNVVQEISGLGGVWGAAGLWPGEGGYVDIPSAGYLHFFKYGEKSGAPALISETKSAEKMAFGSGSPIITSDGTTSGSGTLWIAWCPSNACDNAAAELRAYSPAGSEGARPLWQEKIGLASKFSRPDASNGYVYIGNREGHIIGFGVTAPPDFGRCLRKTGGRFKNAACTLASVPGDARFEWFAGPGPKNKFKTAMKAGARATVESVNHIKLTCSGETSQGEIRDATEVAGITLTFTGCETSGIKCASPGQVEGTVVTAPLEGVLGVQSVGTSPPLNNTLAVELHPASGPNIAEFSCGATPAVVRGSVLHKVTSNKMLTQAAEVLTASKGEQAPDKFAGGAVDAHTLERSTGGGEFEEAGLTITTTVTNEEAIEASSGN
jgi:hypothetical protein